MRVVQFGTLTEPNSFSLFGINKLKLTTMLATSQVEVDSNSANFWVPQPLCPIVFVPEKKIHCPNLYSIYIIMNETSYIRI